MRGTAWTELAADELPTTLRRSPVPSLASLARSAITRPSPPRSRPPPLPPAALPTLVREPLPSLASVLEPRPMLPFLRSRAALVPPDPRFFQLRLRFRRRRFAAWRAWRAEARWLLRIALALFVIAGELTVADPTGALHRPRDAADAGAMISSAMQASMRAALER